MRVICKDMSKTWNVWDGMVLQTKHENAYGDESGMFNVLGECWKRKTTVDSCHKNVIFMGTVRTQAVT